MTRPLVFFVCLQFLTGHGEAVEREPKRAEEGGVEQGIYVFCCGYFYYCVMFCCCFSFGFHDSSLLV